ncbi:beta-ketoacyl synthase [Streptomyces sp. WAC06614]|uniref:beta-ketoacyl-[acyl-carrier-protein] synthase family protein n=1 Tax=Streptomyces sp. WAC06614 TaxID=2487416 RepID=UPI000F7909DF|nr:beta-ketoacyl-[acyl-carrier-protein] synthase family protein [Streptomyces sp. WAC06614]RSS83398.1 beta-ketoacyl-[acyl-carrier-protein] synthase family protein [Streptomyces sp. WAC06614]
MTPRRVVVTGLGAVAPGGVGVKEFWALLTSGRTATRAVTRFDATGFRSRVAGEVDFDPVACGVPDGVDRVAQFALACSAEALADAGLPALPGPRGGVCFGTALGSASAMDAEYRRLSGGGGRWLVDRGPARQLCDWFTPASVAAELARSARAEGPVSVVSTGCTAGMDAVGHAVELIREGSAEVMLAGAGEAPLSPITAACFDAVKATSRHNDTPGTASRPFDRTRAGFVLAEGAAVLVLEEYERARRRGAHAYAEIVGFGATNNAYHMTGLRTDGAEMGEAIRIALREAGLAPGAVDHVNAHGSGTKQNDVHETAALKRALGAHAHRVPVSAIKSMIGHSLGAVGALETVASALAIEHNTVPPTANLHEPDPACDLDYTPLTAREHRTDVVLTVGSGFGGFHSAMVLARPPQHVFPTAKEAR